MKPLKSVHIVAVLGLVVAAATLLLTSGCRPVAPQVGAVVESMECCGCGGKLVLQPAKGAESMDHVCMFCKETWDRLAAYSDSGWVTVCEKCDKVVSACPECQKKMEDAMKAAS
jgi:hypothetical protein